MFGVIIFIAFIEAPEKRSQENGFCIKTLKHKNKIMQTTKKDVQKKEMELHNMATN